jgi:hypothetical protein
MSRDLIGIFKDSYRRTSSPKQSFFLVGAVALVLTLGSTLAANINLGTNNNLEFGQGIQLTTACSGSTQLTITPNATFVNASGAGAYYFSSVTVKNVPSSCYGVDFSLSAYGETSSAPLAIFNTSSTNAIVYNNAGSFEAAAGITGMSVTGSTDSFTVNFASPVALSSTVARITIQSATRVVSACIGQGQCSVGEEGPGGGIIVFTSVGGFTCGPTYSDTCHNLEAAPNNWNSGSNDFVWANVAYQNTFVGGSTAARSLTSDQLGVGYKNSLAIVNEGNDATTAAGIARAYRGGGKSDWYLPSPGDWEKMSAALYPTNLPGGLYWLSSEKQTSPVRAFWGRPDQPTFLNYDVKSGVHTVRPVRAF